MNHYVLVLFIASFFIGACDTGLPSNAAMDHTPSQDTAPDLAATTPDLDTLEDRQESPQLDLGPTMQQDIAVAEGTLPHDTHQPSEEILLDVTGTSEPSLCDLKRDVAIEINASWHAPECSTIDYGIVAPRLTSPKMILNQNLGIGELSPLWVTCDEHSFIEYTAPINPENPCIEPYMALIAHLEMNGWTGTPWDPESTVQDPEPWEWDPIDTFGAMQERLLLALRVEDVYEHITSQGFASARIEPFTERDGYREAMVTIWHQLLGTWDGRLFVPTHAYGDVPITYMLHGHEFTATRYRKKPVYPEHPEQHPDEIGIRLWGSDYGAQELARMGRAVLVMGSRPYLSGYEYPLAMELWTRVGIHITTITLIEDLFALELLRKLTWKDSEGVHGTNADTLTILGHSAGGHRASILSAIAVPQRLVVDDIYEATKISPWDFIPSPHCTVIPGGGGVLESNMERPESYPFEIFSRTTGMNSTSTGRPRHQKSNSGRPWTS